MRLTNRQWTLLGWFPFVACAAFFIAAAVRAGDALAPIGSSFFMAANIAFIVPFYRRPRAGDDRE